MSPPLLLQQQYYLFKGWIQKKKKKKKTVPWEKQHRNLKWKDMNRTCILTDKTYKPHVIWCLWRNIWTRFKTRSSLIKWRLCYMRLYFPVFCPFAETQLSYFNLYKPRGLATMCNRIASFCGGFHNVETSYHQKNSNCFSRVLSRIWGKIALVTANA